MANAPAQRQNNNALAAQYQHGIAAPQNANMFGRMAQDIATRKAISEGQLPSALRNEEPGLEGGVPTENITGLGLSPLDFVGPSVLAKAVAMAKMTGMSLTAALGATAIASKASKGAQFPELATALKGQRGATAWHGSPHLFDKFKNEAIGTGEGAKPWSADSTPMDKARAIGLNVPDFKVNRSLFDTNGLENRGKDLIQSKAEELAQRMRDSGVNVDLQHSGSAAGPSSYLRVAGMPDIRLSGHSKGVFNSQGVINVSTPEEFDAVIAQASKNQSALNSQLSGMAQSYEQAALPIRLASADKKLAKGKALTKSEQEAVDFRNGQATGQAHWSAGSTPMDKARAMGFNVPDFKGNK